jgi:CheY-specific phosphatase CheX
VGLLGFTGTRSGNFVVRTTEKHGEDHRSQDADDGPQRTRLSFSEAADGFGELVNMLSGNFKNAWVANGNQMDLSVPNVIHNGEVRVNSEHEGSLRSCVRVTVEGQVLDVGIHFESKH